MCIVYLLWPLSRAGHCILHLWFLSSFFLAYSQRSQIACLPYFYTRITANLECRSEMCCTRLAKNTGCKNSPSVHHRTTLLDYVFATRACINNRKKLVKQQYLLHTSSQCGELDPLAAEIGWQVWGTPANFNRFCILPSLLQQCHSPEANQTLHDVWLPPGLVHYIYTVFHKKRGSELMSITLPNLNRFSKFFHC